MLTAIGVFILFALIVVFFMVAMTAFLVTLSIALSPVVEEAHRDTYSPHRMVTMDRFAS